jgi:DMSO/TMAO reductase YedYZ molybdopterin-dependent catalytic subunit
VIRDRLAALEPPARLVDGAILVLVLAEVASGLASLLVGTPDWGWLFVAHAVGGLSLVVLLAWKLRRVLPRLRRPGAWPDGARVSVVLATLALSALATGILWQFVGPIRLAGFTLLTLHMVLGLLVVPVLAWHLRRRFRLPDRRDIEGRRTALQFAAAVGAAAITWRLQSVVGRVAGEPDRFTGSKAAGGTGTDFPVTSWVADDPDPIDPDEWRLAVTGEVETETTFARDDLVGGPASVPLAADETAVLDCTSGWYAERDWTGVRLADLLGAVGTTSDARWVSVRSVTGYRWSFRLAEADDLLLATHVDGEALTHGHGAPLRLVAPGHRGFQWVKWVESVEVRRHEDLSQWLAIFVSGFAEAQR